MHETSTANSLLMNRTEQVNAYYENNSLEAKGKEFVTPYSHTAMILTALLVLLLLVIGFFGNLLTIAVIATSKKLKNVFNLLILSLCFSDLFSAMISWINLHRLTWGFETFYRTLPTFFCRLYWGVDLWTSLVTALHILSFSILRLISVWKPYKFRDITRVHAKIWIGVMWTAYFFIGFVPLALFSESKRRDRNASAFRDWPSCRQGEEWLSEYQLYTEIVYPIFLYLPLVAVIVVSVTTAVLIKKKWSTEQGREDTAENTKRKRKEKQAILQLALIVGSFAIGYLPFTAFEFYITGTKGKSLTNPERIWLFSIMRFLCLRFSECLNPLFYNVASTKMRSETKAFLLKRKRGLEKQLLKCKRVRKVKSTCARTTDSAQPSDYVDTEACSQALSTTLDKTLPLP